LRLLLFGGVPVAIRNAVREAELPGEVSEPQVPDGGYVVEFNKVFRSELDAINAHRRFLQQNYPSYQAHEFSDKTLVGDDRHAIDAVGLALSGGGIRSAAFCLGALQALDAALRDPSQDPKDARAPTLLERVDYLSTVSGGGYIGSSLIAGLSKRKGGFPFRSLLDREETPSIKHIRDHSNYLFSRGLVDVLDSFAIYLRGLLANIVIILSPILVLVTFTIYCNPDNDSLTKPILFQKIVAHLFPYGIPSNLEFGSFAFSKLTAIVVLVVFLVWGIISIAERLTDVPIWEVTVRLCRWVAARSRRLWRYSRQQFKHFILRKRSKTTEGFWHALTGKTEDDDFARKEYSEANSRWARVGGLMLTFFLVSLVCELQPWILEQIFEYARTQKTQNNPVTGIGFWFQAVTAALTVIASTASMLSDKLEKLASKFSLGNWLSKMGHYSVRTAIYIGSAAVPLLAWAIYILLCYWAVKSDLFCKDAAGSGCIKTFAAPVTLINFSNQIFADHAPSGLFAGLWAGFASGKLFWIKNTIEFAISLYNQIPVVPGVLASIGQLIMGIATWAAKETNVIGGSYVLSAIILFIISLLPTLNANSLHRLYRDRLSTAFIFYERLPDGAPTWLGQLINRLPWGRHAVEKKASAEAKPEISTIPLDQLKLSLISGIYAPYHIINTALNIQDSKYANQRGRNAEFFMFSRNFVGSNATKYVATKQMESVTRDLNLATAMAVSGAAASSNMGSSTIRPLTPSLSILNVRLGYWLRNPSAAVGIKPNRVAAWIAELANMYFFKEMFGRLDEKTYNVYLTDGGHIENLGLYELIKRRCKLIIAVDAESDPNMNFESFIKLQRHARIDLGTRIELPWQAIRNRALEASHMIADGGKKIPDLTRGGPHAAIGVIRYPNSEIGYLVYIKSSLSGDENDYVIDYRRRNSSFPHEATGDQFFTEEQFEVYRTLGFHATHRIFTGDDMVSTQAADESPPQLLKWTSKATKHNPIPAVRALLRLAEHP